MSIACLKYSPIKKVFLILLVFLTIIAGCQASTQPEITVTEESEAAFSSSGDRILLTVNDLQGDLKPSSPVPEMALTKPDNAKSPLHTFEGRLELLREGELGQIKIYSGGPLGTDASHLPEFNYRFIQHDGWLIPLHRGLVITDHPTWNYHLGPGRVWSEPGDNGYSRASFPFALSWKGSNAILNGTMTFVFDNESISKVWYQVTQETTINTSLDMWGVLEAIYHQESIPEDGEIKGAFSTELAARFPTKPITALEEDYPGIDLEAFGSGVSEEHMTWYGFVIHGVQYLGGCQTRYGTYPYCESMRVPSYSTAKSAFASLALMRLGQKYDPSVPDLLIRDYLPETADSPGNWEEVTFNHTLDMATGNFQTSQRMVDEEKWNTDPFWLEDYYKERIRAALDWPSSAPPGTVWVYRTSDTFVLTAAMQNFLQEVEGSQADIFRWMVDEVYGPLGMGPGFFSTMRTRDKDWNGLPVGGYGLWWIPDDLAKLSTFLGLNEGNINHQVILDPAQLGAALQKDPADRGVVRDGDGRYNNGFWADQYTSPTDPDCTFWVPHMYGYSGIVVAIIPNGTVYYYASDNQEFTTSRAIQESVKLIPVCRY